MTIAPLTWLATCAALALVAARDERAMSAESAAPPPETACALTVATFNIRYGTANDGPNRWEVRRDMAVRAIAAFDADVVGLQEALRFQLDFVLAQLPQFTAVGVGRDDGKDAGEFAAILVRRERWAVLGSGTFWLSSTPGVPGSRSFGNRIPRICTWVRIQERTAPEHVVTVWNVHLDHESQPAREASAELLRKRLSDGLAAHPTDRLLVVGDFNAGPGSPELRALLDPAGTPPFRDAFAVAPAVPREQGAGGQATSAGTFHGFGGAAGGDGRSDRIDLVLVGPGLEVDDCRIDRRSEDGRFPSDHFPVVARLRWRPLATEPHRDAPQGPGGEVAGDPASPLR